MVKHIFKYTLCGKPYQWFTMNTQKAESVKRTMENCGVKFRYIEIKTVGRSIRHRPLNISQPAQ
jgi:hypothetical protein